MSTTEKLMGKLLKHRGYYGSIEANTEDKCLFGQLQFIRSLVSYEGETVAELERAFREAVDDYLDTCERLGKSPEVPCKGSFNVRVGHETHLAAARAAVEHGTSLNELTRRALDEYLREHA